MTSFTVIELAVKNGLTTYKEIVERLCQQDATLAADILSQVSLDANDPKILRKKYRVGQVHKFGKEDTESIKIAMKAYDKADPSKIKRTPPVRKWTDEDKAYTKAKNAYIKGEKSKLSEELSVAEMKRQLKSLGDAYAKENKPKPVAPEQVKPKPTKSNKQPKSKPVQPVVEESDSENELVNSDSED
jgi:hypothetical protein